MLIRFLALSMQAAGGGVRDLAWIAGCWELTRGTRHVTEQWMRPEGELIATVEGRVNGQPRMLEFPYRPAGRGR